MRKDIILVSREKSKKIKAIDKLLLKYLNYTNNDFNFIRKKKI